MCFIIFVEMACLQRHNGDAELPSALKPKTGIDLSFQLTETVSISLKSAILRNIELCVHDPCVLPSGPDQLHLRSLKFCWTYQN